MKFSDKWTIDKTKPGEAQKEEITKEAFAIGEMLEHLANVLVMKR